MGRGKVEFEKGPGGLLVPTPGARLLGLEGGPAPDQVQMQRHLVGQGSTSYRSGSLIPASSGFATFERF